VALVPTILVAVFATITVNMGLEGWFSDRVSTALGNSVDAAVAYQQEHRDDLSQDARALAVFLNANRRAAPFLTDGELRQLLSQGQGRIQRGLREAFVIDGGGEIRARGERSYLFDFERPDDAALARGRGGRACPDRGPRAERIPRADPAGGLSRPLPLCQPGGRRRDHLASR
jgi:two-component system nitrogen regulation sensor histidine kinase NtrY